MKTLVFALLAATILVSCKKSEVIDTPLTNPALNAKIDGAAIQYGVPTAEKETSTTGAETIFISAMVEGTSIQLSLSKQGGITPGSYSASDAAFIGISDGINYYSTSQMVNITITSVDATRIVGSFTGSANDLSSGGEPKAVTEGKFYANF